MTRLLGTELQFLKMDFLKTRIGLGKLYRNETMRFLGYSLLAMVLLTLAFQQPDAFAKTRKKSKHKRQYYSNQYNGEPAYAPDGDASDGKYQDCAISCGEGSAVTVDLANSCMCIGENNCFMVGIGRVGRRQVWDGHGILKKVEAAKGRRFATTNESTTFWNHDALATGTSNDGPGKWVHKQPRCDSKRIGPVSLGCVEVPCDEWPKVKEEIGKEITICGGENYFQRYQNSSAKRLKKQKAQRQADGEDDPTDTSGTSASSVG